MCKEYPGPRCSNHARLKMERCYAELEHAQKQFGPNHIETKKANRAYQEAIQEYKTTPDGLAELKSTDSERYNLYKKLRDYQVEALREVNNGRASKIVKLVTSQQDFYDTNEVESILDQIRRTEERQSFNEANDTMEEDVRNHYFSMLNRQEENLRINHQLTDENMQLLSELRSMKLPREELTNTVYGKLYSYLPQSKEYLKRELSKIASLQDVSLNVVKAYHDAYRQEYNNKYAKLPEKLQPNPPKEWVNGGYQTTGYKNDPTSFLSPMDKATMYATYRLRSDVNAIPDYLKNSRIIATTSLNPDTNEVAIVLYNNKGKEVESSVVNLNGVSKQVLADKLSGKIIVFDNDKTNQKWLSSLNSSVSLQSSFVNTSDLSAKHLNLPDNSLSTFCQATGTPFKENVQGKAESLMLAYFNARRLINKKWNAKSVRKFAPMLETTPLSSRWS